ncbi:unnamed protein product [Allacma fusca]|uniref:Prolyl 4-hydroxylase N-terminal domain-containing protein n=1 Tax=Allacma fusca TaxID=39272 RepID=A0A8J2MCU3_9HEXA|nr:unnamed protein product [Allacma fusca]
MNDFKRELTDLVKNKTGDFNKHAAQLSRVESYLRDFEETTGKVSGNYVVQKPLFRAAKVVWNPVASYHMIRRFAVELKRLIKTLDTEDELQRRTGNHIINIMKDFGWPSEKDLQMHMNSILRVQNVYNLNTSEIARGKIADQDTHVGLSGTDCQEIGKLGMTNRLYTWSLEWLELAAEKFLSESSPMLASLEKEIQHAIVAHDSAWERSAGWEHQYYLNRVSEVPKNRVKRRTVQFNSYKGGKTSNLNEINFWGLCDGENYQDPEEKKKLFCYLESKISNGAWTINPVKMNKTEVGR